MYMSFVMLKESFVMVKVCFVSFGANRYGYSKVLLAGPVTPRYTNY